MLTVVFAPVVLVSVELDAFPVDWFVSENTLPLLLLPPVVESEGAAVVLAPPKLNGEAVKVGCCAVVDAAGRPKRLVELGVEVIDGLVPREPKRPPPPPPKEKNYNKIGKKKKGK